MTTLRREIPRGGQRSHGKSGRASSRAGRPEGQYTSHRRLDKLRAALETHPGGLTLEELASALHVTTRSVRRYLLELNRVLQLESVPTTPGGPHLWRVKPSERGRALNLRRTQAYALLASRRALDVLRGSALFDELDLVYREVEKLAQRPTRVPRGEIPSDLRLEERFQVLSAAEHNYTGRGEDLDKLFLAVAELRELFFRPRVRRISRRAREVWVERETSSTSTRPKDDANVIVHPLALAIDRGALVCIAALPHSSSVMSVPFDDMAEVSLGERGKYQIPSDFDLRLWDGGFFGLTSPQAPKKKVLVEFEADAAERIRSRRFHPSQRMAVAVDGRVRLSFALAQFDEVVSWILSFGPAAHVIEPPELAAAVRESLQQALSHYLER